MSKHNIDNRSCSGYHTYVKIAESQIDAIVVTIFRWSYRIPSAQHEGYHFDSLAKHAPSG